MFFYSCCMLMKLACMVLPKPSPVQKHQPILFIQEIWLCDCSYINGTNPETVHSVSHEYQKETIIVTTALTLLFNDKIEVATVEVLRVEDFTATMCSIGRIGVGLSCLNDQSTVSFPDPP